MINEIFKSTNHVVAERIKNPIVGSIILAWAYINWRIIYLFFNLPISSTYEQKIEKINDYIISNKYELTLKPLLLAFGILISYFILSNLSLIIISFFQKIIKPKIVKFFDKSLVVEREIYNDLKKSHSSSLDELENLQQNFYKIKSERDKYKEEVEKMTSIENLKTLENAKNEMKKLQNENERTLREARVEREKMLEEARMIKNKMVEDAKKEAMKEAEKIIAQAQNTIEAERLSKIEDAENRKKSKKN